MWRAWRVVACVRPGLRASSVEGLRKLSSSSARRPALTFSSPGSLYSGLPQSSPSLSTPYDFPYCGSLLRRWSGPPQGQRSLTFLFSRRRESTLSPFVCSLSHRPSLSSNPAVLPRRVPFGLPEPWSQQEQQGFSSALTRLLAMTRSLPHRSHAHLTTLSSHHASADPQLICLLSAGAAHLTLMVWGGRLTSYLYSVHKSDFESRTPAALHRQSGVLSNSKSLASDRVTSSGF